jgi:hypothetical protein
MSSKILRLHIESFKGVNDLSIDFNDKPIIALIADGGIGKSSVLGFVQACVEGRVPEEAINQVTKKAKGSLDLQIDDKQYTITISRSKKSESVKIKGSDGMEGSKEVLRKIIGPVAISPFELKDLKPEDQLIEYKKLCKIDTAEIDKQLKELRTERTMIGRRKKELEGWLKTDPAYSIDMEEKMERLANPIILDPLMAKLDAANKKIQEIAQIRQTLTNLEVNEKGILQNISDIEEQIANLQKRLEAQRESLKTTRAELANTDIMLQSRLQDEPNIEEIQQEIKVANEHNAERERLQEYLLKYKELEEKQQEYEEKSQEIDRKEKEKGDLIVANGLSVPGLEFREPKTDSEGAVVDDSEGLYFEGKPLSFLSTTEIIKFGVMLKNAIDERNGNKGLPVLIMDDFESVGSKGRAEVERLCREEGYQALVAIMDPEVSQLKVVIQNDLNINLDDQKNGTDQTQQTPAAQDPVEA